MVHFETGSLDRDVDGHDFLAWQWGGSPDPFSADDLASWQAEYHGGLLVAANVAVPEPGAVVLLIVAAAFAANSWISRWR